MKLRAELNTVAAHHAMSGWTSPMRVWSVGFASVVVLACFQRTALALGISIASGVLLWLFACGALARVFGRLLESRYPYVPIDELPNADAIVVLGGGVGRISERYPFPRLHSASDRVMHAVRLWRAEKAPIIVTSGAGEEVASYPLLRELGVPDASIVVEDKSGDTEENAWQVGALLAGRARTILLVTSASHMRRSMMLFQMFAPNLRVMPSAADYIAPSGSLRDLPPGSFVPCAEMLVRNGMMLKECLGILWYKLMPVKGKERQDERRNEEAPRRSPCACRGLCARLRR